MTATVALSTEISEPYPSERRKPDWKVAGAAAAALTSGAVLILQRVHGRQALLFLVGGALGLVLYHAMYGFASAWRRFVVDWRGSGLRSHLLLLALTSTLFLPQLADGSLFGRAVSGSVAPVGLTVVLGAFLFGVGMQLGGG